MTATSPPSDGSPLCTSCGLCCDGALFNRAVSRPEEIERLAAFGIEAITVGDKVRFPLPCPQLDGASCTIYEHRFHICRSFKCKLLNRYLDGEVELETAQQTVATAKKQIAAVAALDPAAAIMRGRMQLRKTAQDWTTIEDPEARRARGTLMFSVTVLEQYLDKHFRRRPEAKTADQAGEAE